MCTRIEREYSRKGNVDQMISARRKKFYCDVIKNVLAIKYSKVISVDSVCPGHIVNLGRITTLSIKLSFANFPL